MAFKNLERTDPLGWLSLLYWRINKSSSMARMAEAIESAYSAGLGAQDFNTGFDARIAHLTRLAEQERLLARA